MITVPRGPLVGAAVARALCEAAMAALPPPDAALLFRAAVATELGDDNITPQVTEIAALLRRLTRLCARLPAEGAYIVQIAFPGMGREPEIRPYRGAWTELD